MKATVIIPARYASSRFPGKPLALLGGTPLIVRVLEQVSKTGLQAFVATDDDRIFRCVAEAGGFPVMTRPDHACGTDRVREAAEKCAPDADIIVNLQGDEPFIRPDQVQALVDIFNRHPDTDIATLVRPLPPDTTGDILSDPALVKAVVGDDGEALYFSRFPVPYLRGLPVERWAASHTYFAHIGIYAYRMSALRAVTEMAPSSLEKAESLEQLRWLQAGMRIRTASTQWATIGIDTPQDLAAAELHIASTQLL